MRTFIVYIVLVAPGVSGKPIEVIAERIAANFTTAESCAAWAAREASKPRELLKGWTARGECVEIGGAK